MITDGLATAFRSKRLIFRALEDNEADRDFLFTQIENDPVSTALANPAMVVPRSSKSAQALVSELAKSTLAVIVCLTPEAAPDVPAQDAALHSTPAPHPTSTSTPTPTPTPTPPSALTPIGFMFLGWGGTPPDRAQHRCTELGLQLAAAFQGKGYGAEAVDWGVDWAFRFGGLHRVTIKTVGYNTRAQHLYTRLGFVEEGRSREAHWHDRKWYDVVSYGMLEGEWAKLRGLEE
ncbi:acyl-CoA N-acyltransferase [Lasiosphaeria ovina]|uniref:Acyl-CoA N-acyltransferase n=1 Tax=Lasiosphaeria ovina TaxID=92902 RepID=A0AAE0NFK0_9PEZI|nr:acyl-CoA N-acyltransferase [Lasiosphaeria ovina]